MRKRKLYSHILVLNNSIAKIKALIFQSNIQVKEYRSNLIDHLRMFYRLSKVIINHSFMVIKFLKHVRLIEIVNNKMVMRAFLNNKSQR